MKIYGVRSWAQIVGLLTILSTLVGGWIATLPPPPPKPCLHMATWSCSGATRCGWAEQVMEVQQVSGESCFLIKCICPPVKP